jgi:prepilin-type N-terminal cleavage/methylation domain-containing protein
MRIRLGRLRSGKGFTLIEMTIVIVLLGVIMAAVTTLYISDITDSEDETRRIELAQSLTIATDNLTDDIKNASAIEATYSTYTTGAQTVVLDLPAVDSSGNLLFSGNNFVVDRVVYSYSGGILTKTVVPGTGSARTAVTRQVLSKITSLSFTYPSSPATGNSQMSYAITVSDSFKKRVETLSGYNTVVLRNF